MAEAGQRRTLIDRLMPFITPKVVAGFAPPPTALAPNLWVLDRRLRMTGGPILPSRTTIIGLPTGGLLVVSPPALAAGGLETLDALGPVEHVVAPNSYHHVYLADFLARYPRARFWAAPGLFARIQGLPAGTELTNMAPNEWSGVVEHAILGPTRGSSEVALFHRDSATLILTDVAFHMVRFDRALDRVSWRLNGVPAGFGPSRTARLLLLGDRPLAVAFVRRLLEWPFRRIIVAHGDAVEVDAAATFRRAFAGYLTDRPA